LPVIGIDIGERLAVGVVDLEASGDFLNGPGCRESGASMNRRG